MQKNKSIKTAIIVIGLIILVAGIVLTIYLLSGKTDSYRSILIYQLEGKAEIEREGTGTIAAADNLYLESGDRIRLDGGSSMRLKLDDDKYIMVEENSILSIQAEGSDQDSRTSIRLEQGAITNEIKNKLPGQSTYEVNSPNSIMAVRGTIFRAEGYVDEKGQNQTKISTFDGTVGFQPIAPDGTRQKEVLIEEGKEAVIRSTTDGIQYLKEPSDIAFSELPPQALRFLQDLMKNGAPVTGISSEALQKLVQEPAGEDKTNSDADPEPGTADNEPSGQEDTMESGSAESNSTGSAGTTPEEDTPSVSSQNSPSPASTPSPGGRTDETVNKMYTVTFWYKGKIFGTQTIQNGHTASKPKLKPAQKGMWDFDFSKKIYKNTTIYWLSEKSAD